MTKAKTTIRLDENALKALILASLDGRVPNMGPDGLTITFGCTDGGRFGADQYYADVTTSIEIG